MSAICRNPHSPRRKPALTISLAALTMQDILPPLRMAVKAELQTLELLVVWFEGLQILGLEKVQTLALQRQALREGEGILDSRRRISGTPNWALTAPSINCTALCTTLCGWMSTCILSAGSPKSHFASVTSNPLFMREAESMVILAPISQVGCLRASAPSPLQLLVGEDCERSARTVRYLVDFVLILAHQTLEDGAMFAIHREDRRMILLSQLADEFTCHNEGFPYSQTDFLAGLDGMDGWFQSREAHHRGKRHLDQIASTMSQRACAPA